MISSGKGFKQNIEQECLIIEIQMLATNNVGMIITCLWSWLDNIDDLGLVLASKITSSKFHA